MNTTCHLKLYKQEQKKIIQEQGLEQIKKISEREKV